MRATRRQAIEFLAATGAVALIAPADLAIAGEAEEERPGDEPSAVAPGRHPLLPLPFDPKRLRGLSQRLLLSHHENNYGGAVRNLNRVEEALASITRESPGFVVAGLKERELTFTNSVILHELYFGNLGGDGKPRGAIRSAIDAWAGGFRRWEELFRATAMSLAGGSGWAIFELSFHTGDLRIYRAGNHAQSLALGSPLLVLDMYEHAYHLDFGADAASYVDAFFANVRWDEVDRRYDRARAAWRALRGPPLAEPASG
jgi:Fe-Mn family superoxide dismutase